MHQFTYLQNVIIYININADIYEYTCTNVVCFKCSLFCLMYIFVLLIVIKNLLLKIELWEDYKQYFNVL